MVRSRKSFAKSSNIHGMHRAPLFNGALILLFLLFTSLVAAQSTAPEISFTVAMPRPDTHLFEIDVAIKRGPTATVPATDQLVMPVWTPGSYMIREFERHVQDFSATDAAGQPLKWE